MLDMPSFFRSKKPKTSADISKQISLAENERLAAQNALRLANVRLGDAGLMDDATHKAALEDVESAQRAIVRAEDLTSKLQTLLIDTAAQEATDALRARADALRARVQGEAPKLLDTYERAAQAIADAVRALESLDQDIADLNGDLRQAGMEIVSTVEDTYRREPNRHVPEKRTTTVEMFIKNHGEPEQRVNVFVERNGKMVPERGDAYPKEVEHVEPAYDIPGQRLPPLASTVVLPAARWGAKVTF